MTDLVELSYESHGDLRVSEADRVAFASDRHIMALRASEVGRAAGAFPIFFSRSTQSGDAVLSVLTSVRSGTNVFVQGDTWIGTYEPAAMQTHPLYLMPSDMDEHAYMVGIDESFASDQENGESLFEDDGQPSAYLSRVSDILEQNIENDLQTHLFAETVEEYGLLKPINLVVFYDEDVTETVTGLSTIDEDQLQSMEGDVLEELNSNGYLMVLHAMLVSVFQLNLIIQRHNQLPNRPPINQIKLEAVGDDSD